MTGYNPCDDDTYEWIPRHDLPDWLIAKVHQATPIWTVHHGNTCQIAALVECDWVTGEVVGFCLEFTKGPDGRISLRHGRRLRPNEIASPTYLVP